MRCIWCESVQGESHKATDKECQDTAFATVEPDMAIAVVSDGHGGGRYFRSKMGSSTAVERTRAALADFARHVDASIFAHSPFTDIPTEADRLSAKNLKKAGATNAQEQILWQLFGYILHQWTEDVKHDALERPLSEEEKNSVSAKYVTAFESIDKVNPDRETFTPFYGATLIAYVQTPDFWLAFQIGDGELVTLEKDASGKLSFSSPIPKDEKCFRNLTTSICDSDAINEIRCCFGGRDTRPLAVFLCSDGVSESLGTELHNTYANFLIQALTSDNPDEIAEGLPEDLAVLSRKGNGDDMSLVCLYDDGQQDLCGLLLDAQESALEIELNKSIAVLTTKSQKLNGLREERNRLTEKIDREISYQEKVLKKAQQHKESLESRQEELRKVRSDFIVLHDDIQVDSEVDEESESAEITPDISQQQQPVEEIEVDFKGIRKLDDSWTKSMIFWFLDIQKIANQTAVPSNGKADNVTTFHDIH